jgi:hypothetical protein
MFNGFVLSTFQQVLAVLWLDEGEADLCSTDSAPGNCGLCLGISQPAGLFKHAECFVITGLGKKIGTTDQTFPSLAWLWGSTPWCFGAAWCRWPRPDQFDGETQVAEPGTRLLVECFKGCSVGPLSPALCRYTTSFNDEHIGSSLVAEKSELLINASARASCSLVCQSRRRSIRSVFDFWHMRKCLGPIFLSGEMSQGGLTREAKGMLAAEQWESGSVDGDHAGLHTSLILSLETDRTVAVARHDLSVHASSRPPGFGNRIEPLRISETARPAGPRPRFYPKNGPWRADHGPPSYKLRNGYVQAAHTLRARLRPGPAPSNERPL